MVRVAEQIDIGELPGRSGSLARPRRALRARAWGVEGPFASTCASWWRCGSDLESLLPDGQGSTRLVTDADGEVMQTP
jgi:hypothetical protein